MKERKGVFGFFILILFSLMVFIGMVGYTTLEINKNCYCEEDKNNNIIGFCYHDSVCTKYIYTEQLVGCYHGCKFGLSSDYTYCMIKCELKYYDTFEQYVINE